MVPLICLVVAVLLFRGIGAFVPYFADGQTALRAALGAMFLFTASVHWGKRRPDLIRMVPRGIGNAGLWVSATGVCEIAIAIGLQIPHHFRWTAAAAILMLCCLFPANVKAAREHLTIPQRPVVPLFPQLILQLAFLAALGAVLVSR